MRYRITQTGGTVKAGNGAIIRGRYALYYGKDFIGASDDAAELIKLMGGEDVGTAVEDIAVALCVCALVWAFEKLVLGWVPL